MDAQRAGGRIERELLILTRHLELTSPRRVRLDHNALDRSAYVLLSRLEAQGPMSVPDLVDAFGLTPSTLTRQTTALLRDGLVERTLDPRGGIARQFRITDEGRGRLRTDRDAIAAGLADVLGDWPADRRRRFVEDLERFNTDIEERTGRPWPR
ncbi:MarR family winged helix-turn-helix transcriptional regulator [Streptomyces sp. NPDC059897]|uniref:MarR family winged helix-turn-helix transcriptional regulator n=1 Tax=Streptomyces sp. NPDC059897 TaxID=3346994 RepID=UPI003650CFF0